MRRRFLAPVLAGVSAMLLLVPPAGASPATTAGPAAPVPVLDWTDCGDGLECATATVPLDHARPDGRTIELAVARVPAADPTTKLGSLFVNPGGPGGSGLAFLRGTPPPVREVFGAFDLVGFDPRGVGASTPVDCRIDQEERGLFAQPLPRRETLDVAEEDRDARSYARLCLRRNDADLLAHLSTADVARDLDLLRQAVGDERLTYAGKSYGTLIGATYASLFPDSTGRLVLDGGVDPDLWLGDPLTAFLEQSQGYEHSLDRFAEACASDQTACAGFGGTDPRAALAALLDRLDAAPVPAAGSAHPEPVDGDDARLALVQGLGSVASWPLLAQGLAAADAGDGTVLRGLADDFYGRAPDGENTPFYDQFSAVNASEARYPEGLQPYLRAGERADALLPIFDFYTGYAELPLGRWRVEAAAPYLGPFETAADAPTTLVVGTVHDNATPYAWSQRLTADLGNARLLTMDGDGHTAFGAGSPCIDVAVVTYLIAGVLPAEGTVCPQAPPLG